MMWNITMWMKFFKRHAHNSEISFNILSFSQVKSKRVWLFKDKLRFRALRFRGLKLVASSPISYSHVSTNLKLFWSPLKKNETSSLRLFFLFKLHFVLSSIYTRLPYAPLVMTTASYWNPLYPFSSELGVHKRKFISFWNVYRKITVLMTNYKNKVFRWVSSILRSGVLLDILVLL